MGYKYALKVGTVLNGKYEIIPVDDENNILGVGGFGITYKCYDKSTSRNIVIKEFFPSDFAIREGINISPKSSNDKESFELGLKSFIKETKTLAKFHGHPNIVDIYERFEENNTSYFVMPFQKGQSLKDMMKEKTFSEEEIISLITALLDGLKEVHTEGVLHRDLKPDNIFMKENNIPVLIDFGSAKDTLSERTKLLTGVAAVSAGYAAPEQYSRKLKQGPFTDIHALGIIIYQLITKSKDNDIPTSTDRTLDVPLEWPENLNQQYSEKLITVAKRASSLSSNDRFQDAMSMRHALLENPNAPKNLKNPPPPPPPVLPPISPLKKLDLKKIVLVVGVSIVTIYSFFQFNKKEKVVDKIELVSTLEKNNKDSSELKSIKKFSSKILILDSKFINSERYEVYTTGAKRAFYLGAMLTDAKYLIKMGKKESVKLYFLINKIKLNGGMLDKGEQKRIEKLLDNENWSEIPKEIKKIDIGLKDKFKKSKQFELYIIGALMEHYRLLVEQIKIDYTRENTQKIVKHPLLDIKSIELESIKTILNGIKPIINNSNELSKEQVEELSKILKKMSKKGSDA